MTTDQTLDHMQDLTGRSETSEWLQIDESHLKDFARASYLEPDRVDLTPSRNHAMGPTLVDGFLMLSLLVYFDFASQLFRIPGGYGFNYGLDRVRFTKPVFVGDRVRLTRTVVDVVHKSPTRLLVTLDCELEMESTGETAMVARWLYMIVDGKAEA
ncbi:MaoC/PaaZ C-terminal domain-containing protein [Ornithinimicrobium cavernae]|uniref:MaoC/PaaZ C-terminal domain-containing protein n=1 Tax=Ornithinimicrobium cavernae TaxID=2666047 RepID=UPI0012B17C1E|nr:MaoC/PaaZ C-terminal domain-containing protein [Ornithinimicrobium cavernae]